MSARVIVADADGAVAVPIEVQHRWLSVDWIFERHGFTALDWFRKCKPALAVINLQLLDMCGARLAEKLRKGRPQVPILITSNWDGSAAERVARSLGVIGFFVKPVHPAVWDRVLEAVCPPDRLVMGETDHIAGE